MKYAILLLIPISSVSADSGSADLVRATVPSLDGADLTASAMVSSSSAAARARQASGSQQGYWTRDGNIAFDRPIDPKCVFYVNYADGGGSPQQTAAIGNVNFNCE